MVIRLPKTLDSDFRGKHFTLTHEVVFTLSWDGICNNHWKLAIPMTVCPSFGRPRREQASAPPLSLPDVNPIVNGNSGTSPPLPVAEEVAAEYSAVNATIPADWRASHVQVATAVALPNAPEEPPPRQSEIVIQHPTVTTQS